MLDLASEIWHSLETPSGSAGQLPSRIATMQSKPTTEAFDELWDNLTGVGDLQITDAFWPTIPHLVDPVLRLPQHERELALGQIGWGVALASSVDPPQEFAKDFHSAITQLAQAAFDSLQMATDGQNARYLLATIAACSGSSDIALRLIAES